MGNDNVLDQNEIERLLGGMGAGPQSGTVPKSDPTPAPDANGVLNQNELDALFNSAPTPPTPAPTTDSSPTLLDQTELDSLLGGGSSAIPSASAPSVGVSPPAAATPAPPFPQSAPPTRPKAFASSSQSSVAFSEPAIDSGAAGPLGFGGGFGDFDDENSEENEGGIPWGDIDYLQKRADESLRSIDSTPMDLPAEVIEFQFPEFGGTVPSTEHTTLDGIGEVELDVKIELGRTDMYIEDILKLRKGSVVPLDKMAGDPVDIYINKRLVARGEVLVLNENISVRVAELLAGAIPNE
jgi:flagellar motor switch protein FliN/FliY